MDCGTQYVVFVIECTKRLNKRRFNIQTNLQQYHLSRHFSQYRIHYPSAFMKTLIQSVPESTEYNSFNKLSGTERI